MEIELLTEGMIFKNYKEMCNHLKIDFKEGNSRNAQYKELQRYFKFSKNGHSIYIENIYKEPLEKENNHKGNNRKHPSILITHPEISARIIGIDKVELSAVSQWSKQVVDIQCEKCPNVFKRKVRDICKNNAVKCNICLLSKNAKRIYDFLNQIDVKLVLEYEFNGLVGIAGGNLRFDFALFDQEKLVGLIEYDGEFHDKHDVIQKHDKLKNCYCKDNNIPLLRVHHSENNILTEKIANYLVELKLNVDQETIEQIIHNEKTIELKKKINYHENKLKELIKELKNHTEAT